MIPEKLKHLNDLETSAVTERRQFEKTNESLAEVHRNKEIASTNAYLSRNNLSRLCESSKSFIIKYCFIVEDVSFVEISSWNLENSL